MERSAQSGGPVRAREAQEEENDSSKRARTEGGPTRSAECQEQPAAAPQGEKKKRAAAPAAAGAKKRRTTAEADGGGETAAQVAAAKKKAEKEAAKEQRRITKEKGKEAKSVALKEQHRMAKEKKKEAELLARAAREQAQIDRKEARQLRLLLSKEERRRSASELEAERHCKEAALEEAKLPPSDALSLTATAAQLQWLLHVASKRVVAERPALQRELTPLLVRPPEEGGEDVWAEGMHAFCTGWCNSLRDCYKKARRAKGEKALVFQSAFRRELHELRPLYNALFSTTERQELNLNHGWTRLYNAVLSVYLKYNQYPQTTPGYKAKAVLVERLDRVELGSLTYIAGFLISSEICLAQRKNRGDTHELLRKLPLPKGVKLSQRYALATAQVQARCLYAKLRLARQSFLDWLEQAELVLRGHLDLNKLLSQREDLVANAWAALKEDKKLISAWRILCATSADTCTVQLALSSQGERVAVALRCDGATLAADFKACEELREQILRRFLHTRAKYFFRELSQLAKSYKQGQAIRPVLKTSLACTNTKEKPTCAFNVASLTKMQPVPLHAHLQHVAHESIGELDKLTELHMQALLHAYGEKVGSKSATAAALRARVVKAIKEKPAFITWPLELASAKKKAAP